MFNTLNPPVDKGKKAYATQKEVDAANQFAREFLKRKAYNSVTNPEDAYVAKMVGDAVVPFTGEAIRPKKLATSLPSYVQLEDIKGDSDTGYYYENNDGDMVDIEPFLLSSPRFRKPQIMAGMMKGLANNL